MFPIRDNNPSGRVPFVNWALIALNMGLFVWTWLLQPHENASYDILYTYGMVPSNLTQGAGWMTLVTSMFLHAGWGHILGNMLFLWIFGDNIEDAFGHVKYLCYYIASGVAAGLFQYVFEPYSHIPVIGASGAIAGVLGGYLFLFPKARVDILVLFKVFTLPAWVVLTAWFGFQVFGGLNAQIDEDGGVAYWAHAGGFIAGIALTALYWWRNGAQSYWRSHNGRPPNPSSTYLVTQYGVPRVVRRK